MSFAIPNRPTHRKVRWSEVFGTYDTLSTSRMEDFIIQIHSFMSVQCLSTSMTNFLGRHSFQTALQLLFQNDNARRKISQSQSTISVCTPIQGADSNEILYLKQFTCTIPTSETRNPQISIQFHESVDKILLPMVRSFFLPRVPVTKTCFPTATARNLDPLIENPGIEILRNGFGPIRY